MPHAAVDVQAIGCDAIAFSGHKMYGPTGIGALWARRALLDAMPPWQGGGDMIKTVTFEASTWNDLPWKFEAGTPNIAGAIGMGAAAEWITKNRTRRISKPMNTHLLERCQSNVCRSTRSGADDRYLTRQGGGRLVPRRWPAPPRCRHLPRSAWCRRPHGPPLRLAADAAIRHPRHSPGIDGERTTRLDEMDRFADALERVIEVFG